MSKKSVEGYVRRDVIVIGGSMGGLNVVKNLLSALPADFPASLFCVLHTAADAPGIYPEILQPRTSLRVVNAEDNIKFEKGVLYMAPPDRHLLLHRNRIRLGQGPRENRWRPAIDPLFRSAAAHHNTRVIGIVLSGLLDDGTSGMRAIQRCGGITVVQDPQDAEFSEMPVNVTLNIKPDYQVPAADMGSLLERLVRQRVRPRRRVPRDIENEARIAEGIMMELADMKEQNNYTSLSCPECGGALKKIDNGQQLRFRCHVGHAFSSDTLLADQNVEVERALVIALRIIEERMQLLRMASHRHHAHERLSQQHTREIQRLETHASALRQILGARIG